ncbi:signal peptidase II [Rubrimonas cliftonensis]|uniref:signal peptidase II n=1 Tax=Rubrimonas cliftonensis TaxID=89524 RepID=UPI001FE085C4|nr:signal peptidase II [Rubrimonas cliftonensis]
MSGAGRMAAAALAIVVADRASKLWVVEGLDLARVGRIEVVEGFFSLRMAWNRGVNFGLFADDAEELRWALIALAAAISVAVGVWAMRRGDRLSQFGAGVLIGGALGNAWDRATYGAVADFLNVTCCGLVNPYAFNVADVAIFAGAAALALAPSGGGRAGDAAG